MMDIERMKEELGENLQMENEAQELIVFLAKWISFRRYGEERPAPSILDQIADNWGHLEKVA